MNTNPTTAANETDASTIAAQGEPQAPFTLIDTHWIRREWRDVQNSSSASSHRKLLFTLERLESGHHAMDGLANVLFRDSLRRFDFDTTEPEDRTTMPQYVGLRIEERQAIELAISELGYAITCEFEELRKSLTR